MIAVSAVYVCAHFSFLFLGCFMLSDACRIPDEWLSTPDSKVFGLVFISEKIMIYKHSQGVKSYIPELLSLTLSIVLIQTQHTFECLKSTPRLGWLDGFMLLNAVACVAGFNLLLSNDHRDRYTPTYSQWPLHVVGVILFICGFAVVHTVIALAYKKHAVITHHATAYAWYRRTGYVVGDGVYLSVTLLFLVSVFFQQILHAIVLEYVLLLLFFVLNSFSLILWRRLWCRLAFDANLHLPPHTSL